MIDRSQHEKQTLTAVNTDEGDQIIVAVIPTEGFARDEVLVLIRDHPDEVVRVDRYGCADDSGGYWMRRKDHEILARFGWGATVQA